MKIQKGDKVKVISGKDKGVESTVEMINGNVRSILIKGVNKVKKHLKSSSKVKGGIVTMDKPVHVSNVMLVCPKCSKPTRVRYGIIDNKKYRVCKKCEKAII